MAGWLDAWKGDRLARAVVLLIGLHSVLLGLLLLFATRFVLGVFGFAGESDLFFPSQSGVFLLILGICYLLALGEPALASVILVSKALAVVFLFAHAVFLHAPRAVWAAGAGDGTMLVLLLLVLRRHRRRRLAAGAEEPRG